jgi:hypothetical protein
MTPYYEQSGITIYHGDCREVMPRLRADVLVTDPPYGINHASNFGASWNGTQIAHDADTSARDVILRCAPSMPAIVFGSWKQPRPLLTREVLIWDKGPNSGMGDLSFPCRTWMRSSRRSTPAPNRSRRRIAYCGSTPRAWSIRQPSPFQVTVGTSLQPVIDRAPEGDADFRAGGVCRADPLHQAGDDYVERPLPPGRVTTKAAPSVVIIADDTATVTVPGMP